MLGHSADGDTVQNKNLISVEVRDLKKVSSTTPYIKQSKEH